VAQTEQAQQEVLHDEDNGKFYIPYPDKQAVLRYTQEDGEIEFQSIFIPPSLRENGLEDKIVQEAFEYARENELDSSPASPEDFFEQNSDHV